MHWTPQQYHSLLHWGWNSHEYHVSAFPTDIHVVLLCTVVTQLALGWFSRRTTLGTSLVAQWLTLCTPNAGGLGSIPSQETRSHVLQLKIPYATMNV